MKKIFRNMMILLVIFNFSLFSQSNTEDIYNIDSSVVNFIYDLVENPHKIQNLKKYHTIFYDSTIISLDYQDSAVIHKWEKILSTVPVKSLMDSAFYKEFNPEDKYLRFYKMRMLNQEITANDIFSIILYVDKCWSVGFDFIKLNNNYYFHSLYKVGIYNCHEHKD